MKLSTLFRTITEEPTQQQLLAPEDLDPEIRPMTELDHFISRTKVIVEGLDQSIIDLDAEITRKIAQLNDLRRIRQAQALALHCMEGREGE